MIDSIAVTNLLLYSVQIAALALAAWVAAALFRVDAAGVRYAYWRAIGLLCLALPWLQPRVAPAAVASAPLASALEPVAVLGAGAPPSASVPAITPVTIGLSILALGLTLRLAWLCAGLAKLRQLRRTASRCPPCTDHDELQRTIGTRAGITYVDGLPQPVTFGIFRPIVLLPSSLRNHPERVRCAVVAHELLHVQRRDWAWVLVEELIRTVFWFHPAVWWIVSRVQLAREEVVDELTVLVTGQRRTYVEALLAFADEFPLAPAPAFARRRHLFRRMMLISKEAVMSPKQIVASCALMGVMVVAGGWYAVRAFPSLARRSRSTRWSSRRDRRTDVARSNAGRCRSRPRTRFRAASVW